MAGLFMIVSYSLNVISTLIYFNFIYDTLFFRHVYILDFFWVLRIVIDRIALTGYVVGIAFFVMHGRINKDKYLLYSIIALIVGMIGGGVLNWILPLIFQQ